MSDCRFGVSPVHYPDPDPDFELDSLVLDPEEFYLFLNHFLLPRLLAQKLATEF